MTGLSRPRTSHANVAEHWVHPLWAVRPVVRPYVPLLHGFSLPVSELPVEDTVRGIVRSLRLVEVGCYWFQWYTANTKVQSI